MPDCVFCKISTGEIPSEKVYEDENVFAFLDITPNHPGHTLVIPKVHSKNVFDIDPEEYATLMKAVQKVAKAVYKGVHADGLNIISNNEPGAGQVVFHTHIHVIPRYKDDGFKFFPQTEYKEGEMAVTGEKIRAAFE